MLITKQIHSVGVNEEGFPSRLQSISNPPSVLYYLGEFSLLNASKLIAIVGTRTPTPKGIEECQFITQWFIKKGYLVISGLALGIDTVVHETCLNNLGKTIAILPSGILNIYPPENKGLAEKIVNSGGLILSEYPERTSAKNSSFIQRDRLQSGASDGCVVIESEISGGTMHTAKFAIKQKRLLGCVEFPNDMDSEKRSGNRKLHSLGKSFRITRETLSAFEMKLINLI